MPTVRYDRSLYVTGFRPGSTNPFAATQLSGVFEAAGGWGLHGLGAIVEDGAIVSYQGKWPLGGKAASELLAQIASALTQDGLTVRSVSSDAGFVANTPYIPFVQQLTFNVKLQVQVANGMGYGDPNDVVSIIRHEVYAATGQFPLSDSVVSVQHPASAGGGLEQTGQPGVEDASQTAPQDWGAWLQQNAWLIAATAIGVFVVPKMLGR